MTLYTKESCPACERLKKKLDEKYIKYEEVDLVSFPKLVDEFVSKGFETTPILETDDGKLMNFSQSLKYIDAEF